MDASFSWWYLTATTTVRSYHLTFLLWHLVVGDLLILTQNFPLQQIGITPPQNNNGSFVQGLLCFGDQRQHETVDP